MAGRVAGRAVGPLPCLKGLHAGLWGEAKGLCPVQLAAGSGLREQGGARSAAAPALASGAP